MNSFFAGILHDVFQIEKQRFFKIPDSLLFAAQPCGEQGVNSEAQGGIVQGFGLIVIPCGLNFLPAELFRTERHVHQHSRLLQHLIPLEAVEADLVVKRHVVVFMSLNIQRLQQIKGCVLLPEGVFPVAAKHDLCGDIAPLFALLRPEACFIRQSLPYLRICFLHPLHGRSGQCQVISCEADRVKVIDRHTAVFIRPLDKKKMVPVL